MLVSWGSDWHPGVVAGPTTAGVPLEGTIPERAIDRAVL